MFKPLLRTLPSLTGNFTIACKLKEFIKENNNEYSTYVRLANIMPLQTYLSKKDIELNLLNGKYEYDISKYNYYYSNSFYKENFQYDNKNYKVLDLNVLGNDSRNKDYEFGCKRIYYSQYGNQFNFYAPFYLDNVNDLPEYFCIHIIFNDTIEKKIKIYINKDNKRNYLKNYLTRYFKQIDDKVIFCLPDSLQATYFGIDIKKGGIVKYKDNVFGNLYVNQTTINNFDWQICQGFERNNLIMKQIFPLSFSFNINDIFNKYDKDFFSGAKLKIYGFYYTKNNIKHNLYDFDINYTNMYQRYKKYNENTGKYEFVIGKDNSGNNINIMNVGFPALNESKYVKYAYTNKITPKYCKFKMLYSSDDDPYITNVNFAYSFLQYPNQKYGYFPTMFKGINPKAIIDNEDLKLPIGTDLDTYYKVSKYSGNKVITDTANVDKYIKLMSNYYSSWYELKEYEDDNLIDNLFYNSTWSPVKYNYSYYRGILYNLSFLKEYNIDKFGVFLDIKMNYVSKIELDNDLIKAKYILSKSDVSSNVINNYNDLYNMLTLDGNTNVSYYHKLFDVINNTLNTNNKYVHTNETVVSDIKGKYIEETNYIEENTFYKISDIVEKLGNYINDNEIINKFKSLQVAGYLLLDSANNINYFEEYKNTYKEKNKRFIFTNRVYDTNEYTSQYSWIESSLYYSSASHKTKNLVSKIYKNIDSNEDIYEKIIMFIKTQFINKYDIITVLLEFNKYDLLTYFSEIDSYIYEPIGNINGVDINEYFILNKNLDKLNIYVDPYNLINYVNLYNKNNKKNLSTIFSKSKDFYIKLLSKDHVKEYINSLNKDEYGNSILKTLTTDLYKSTNDKIKVYANILDYLYIKERCWVIDNNVMKTIDRYLSLYDYLKRYNYNLIFYMHSSYDNNQIIDWLLSNISETRSINNNFVLTFNDEIIELNLCFKKQMILLNADLRQILNDKYFLYLYIQDSQIINNTNIWPIVSLTDITNNTIENSDKTYEYKTNEDYLIPLFNDPYVNDNDCNTIFNMLSTNKINNENKYIINNGKYFKEIDVDNEILNICTNEESFIKNWINEIFNYTYYNKDNKRYEKVLNIDLLDFEQKWNTYCYDNNIYFDDLKDVLEQYNEKIEQLNNELNNQEYSEEYKLDIKNTIKYYENLKYAENKKYVLYILNYLKTYCDNDIYYYLIQNKGIKLYSIKKSLNIEFDKLTLLDNSKLSYIDKYKIYVYKDNDITYAFYWISLNINNTNYSFNILNDYNLNMLFNSINNIQISSNKFNTYFNKIFYLIEPFLKINIFNELTKNINSIVYPYESEININYIQSLLNKDEYNKYTMLQDSDNDILYNEIIKAIDSKKIKLLRYFNYITPYLKETYIIEDSWKLKFIDDNNVHKNIKKYNNLEKTNINIYEYDGINLYEGTYNNEYHKYDSSKLVQQYEYKHFNDNLLYNLPEEIIIKDKKQYSKEDLNEIKENKEELEKKKIKILLKYFNKKGLDYSNIILFLFNKYKSNMTIECINTTNTISKKIYNISYKFNLL